eukprot:scaffold163331_cov40-Prasinocladus_malaysianus.AAC.1
MFITSCRRLLVAAEVLLNARTVEPGLIAMGDATKAVFLSCAYCSDESRPLRLRYQDKISSTLITESFEQKQLKPHGQSVRLTFAHNVGGLMRCGRGGGPASEQRRRHDTGSTFPQFYYASGLVPATVANCNPGGRLLLPRVLLID